jgi:UTP--glucose-1-phosphate uridylyltransferase
VALVPELAGIPPHVELDDHCKLVDQLEAALAGGVPSLRGCTHLVVKGPVLFTSEATFEGKVTVENPTPAARPIPPGIHRDTHLVL